MSDYMKCLFIKTIVLLKPTEYARTSIIYTVSTYDEYPETNIFKLKYKGVLVDLYWMEDNQVDYVKLMLVLDKYTDDATKNNNSLANSKIRVLVELTPKNIRQTLQ